MVNGVSDQDEALQRRPLKEDIYEVLHRRIIAGKYSPGEWLRQEDIASQLKVSQTPVREALDLLVAAGLAERVPYRGVRVLQPTTDEILDSYAVRLLLECAVARGAAVHARPEQIEALARTLEQMRTLVTLNDMSHLQQLNREFHLGVAAACGNAILLRMYETVINIFPDWMLYEAMFRHPERLEASLDHEFDHHRALLAAVSARDADAAMRQAREHILHLGIDMETLLGIPHALIEAQENQVLLQQLDTL